ncbi:MAG TPA: FAD-binding oxidoreductase [Pyrinomonadaceae bacterium]
MLIAESPRDTQSSVAHAIREWQRAIGNEHVIVETEKYNVDTSSFSGRIPVALRPACTEQVQQVVKIAQRFAIPIYPISTGHNWGYGTSVPVRSFGAIVDLSSLNRIIGFDRELGVVTLEPGVTQGQLSEYLHSRGLPFMVPVTGAGPSCSVVANALERGFGVTPITDHFGAIISMKVVLPGGEIYESYTRAFDTAGVAQAFKWGTGPYLDGLFSQSNLGIVVDASIALQARAERSGALFFVLDTNQDVERATVPIRQLLGAAGQNIGAINVMSRRRVECMMSGAQKLSGYVESLPAGAWFGFGSVYGSKEHFRATCRLVKRCLRGYARQVRIYTSNDLERLRWLSTLATRAGWPQLSGLVDRLEAAVDIVDGFPSTVALPLAYAKSGQPRNKNALDPARDGCGLFWYSPIVPLRRGVVAQFIEFAEHTCSKHGLLAPITLTTLSPRCYASTIPLLFDRADPKDERRAKLCFEELYEKGRAFGFVPYRTGSQFMPALERNGSVGPVVSAIKRALDPNQVLAPGRYSFD